MFLILAVYLLDNMIGEMSVFFLPSSGVLRAKNSELRGSLFSLGI